MVCTHQWNMLDFCFRHHLVDRGIPARGALGSRLVPPIRLNEMRKILPTKIAMLRLVMFDA